MWYVYAGHDCYECGLGQFDNETLLGAVSDLSEAYGLFSGILDKVHQLEVIPHAIHCSETEPPRFYHLVCAKAEENHVIRYTYTWRNRYDKSDVAGEHVASLPITINLDELTETAKQVCEEIGASFVSSSWFMADMRFFTNPTITINSNGENLRIGISEDVLTHADAKALIKPLIIERLDQHREWKLSNAWSTQVGVVGSGRVAPTNTVTINLPYDINGSLPE